MIVSIEKPEESDISKVYLMLGPACNLKCRHCLLYTSTQPDILSNGGEWGDPEHPKCDGIPLSDITKINWDLINLDEMCIRDRSRSKM